MRIISLVGCNAVGKTTAALRYVERYPRLQVAEADTQRFISDGKTERALGWKLTNEDKRDLILKHQQERRITLVVSARTSHLLYIAPEEPVLIVICSWQLYEKHMKARCAAKGKRFRDDYWTEYKLRYECSQRYTRWAEKNLHLNQYKIFEIKDQTQDWPAVDEYFGQVYRRLHNLINRGSC